MHSVTGRHVITAIGMQPMYSESHPVFYKFRALPSSLGVYRRANCQSNYRHHANHFEAHTLIHGKSSYVVILVFFNKYADHTTM